MNKLHAPTKRQLNKAHQFWTLVRSDFNGTGRGSRFRDIYSNRPIAEKFSIDHFLPWSFVIHDLFWNLTPVELATNSATVTKDGWQHERIDLVPDNPDRQRFPVLTFSVKEDADLQVIAEFIQMLTPKP